MNAPRLAKGLMTAAVAVLVAACAPERPVGPADFDYRVAHPLSAEARTAVLTLELPAPGAGLGARDAQRLSLYAQDFVKKGEGMIELVVAAPEADAAGAGLFAETLVRSMVAQGVRPDQISARLVTGDGLAASGSALLRYRQWTAVVPECGDWSRSLAGDMSGRNMPDFGCATQRNIGMMVANPRDLVRPTPMEPGLGAVGARVLDRHTAGQPTHTRLILPDVTRQRD